ncbi:MAG: hypothetical protein JSV96_14525 [Candidatus Aminicenantes bacterium]|nr:MAG: hypothetical protein JSV96_14525 [Candidatus Aminicenantes bacterium]
MNRYLSSKIRVGGGGKVVGKEERILGTDIIVNRKEEGLLGGWRGDKMEGKIAILDR